MASQTQIRLLILMLIYSQQLEALVLPRGNYSVRASISVGYKGPYSVTAFRSFSNISTVTRFPPTTTIQITEPNTIGTIETALETEGHASVQPFPTDFVGPTISITIATASHLSSSTDIAQVTDVASVRIANESSVKVKKTTNSMNLDMHKRAATDCFQAVSSGSFPPQITSRGDHPVQKLGIIPQASAVSTNKFYANLFLGTQSQGIWTHPYSVAWSKGGGSLRSWGLSVSHIDADQRAYGPQNNAIPGSPVQYFINPVGIQSIILSAIELGPSTVLTTDELKAFSVNANLLPQAGSSSSITFPLVQGMGFVTAIYKELMPSIQSGVIFRNVVPMGSNGGGAFKYRITLEDGKTWLLYATPSNGEDPRLRIVSSTQLQGVRGWCGMIQVSKNPAGQAGETILDASAGIYPTSASISGSVSDKKGSYQIRWNKVGLSSSQSLLIYALPHHIQSFDGATSSNVTRLQLQTTTKGMATAVSAEVWTMVETSLPTDMGFAPWTPNLGSRSSLSAFAMNVTKQVALSEVNQDYYQQTDLDSMYFSGKALNKFAMIIYTIHDILKEPDLAWQGLEELKGAFARFSTNRQKYPLVYDSVWNGVVSTGSYMTGDAGQDFGNTYYNDHHFHYGYFIHTAAVIAYLDPNWPKLNADYVNTLVRDAANPTADDPHFPFSRMFDWYHGHSFAKGLFESADSKDEESSSEDAFFAYAIKMWGQVTGDASMEARGNLMLSILSRTLDNYFLLRNDNANQPPNSIGNKVTGIIFENKIDHTTYFGTNPEYIQGIHMLPLSASSAFTRTPTFIQEEWAAYFSDSSFNPASKVAGGWRGILYGNLACINPTAAWQFFSQQNFDMSWIDGGASRTWYLAFAAALSES